MGRCLKVFHIVGVRMWPDVVVFVFQSDLLDWQQKPADIKNDGAS